MNKIDFPVISHIELRDDQVYIVGRNLKVKMVISRLIHGIGATVEAVMEQYNLSRSEVLACLEYYYDHQRAIDRVFELEDQELSRVAVSSADWKSRVQARLNLDNSDNAQE